MRRAPLTWLCAAISLPMLTIAMGCGNRDQAPATPAHPAATKPVDDDEKATRTLASSGKDAASDLIQMSAEQMRSAKLTTEPVQPAPVIENLTLTAVVRPNPDRYARVAPRIPGKIILVSVAVGHRVTAGQALAVIDSVEMGEARATYQQAMSEVRLTQAAYDRSERLFAEDIVPLKDFLRAKADLERARTAATAATERLRMYGGLAGATTPLTGSSFAVTAPFGGTIVERKGVIGELAKPEEPLFTIADLSSVLIEADVFERDLGNVAIGQSAKINVAAYPGDSFPGRVTHISSSVSKETRTVKILIAAANPTGRLKLDMFAEVMIGRSTMKTALQVPNGAVVMLDGNPVVFILTDAGIRAKSVEIGSRTASQTVVRSGLTSGDQVVTQGAYALKARLLKSQIGDKD